MNQYPNNYEQPQGTGPDYARGYQSQPSQQPVYPPGQYPPPGYPPPQSMPAPGLAYPQQMAYQQPMYPQQQMMMPPQQMQTNVVVNLGNQRPAQVSMLVRMIYFCLIGAWLGMLWLFVALGFCCSVIGLPIGLMMLNRLGAVMTLSRR